MDNKLLSSRLREMATNTGTLNCLGCGYEHSCGIHGCSVLKKAAEIVESAPEWISVKDMMPEPKEKAICINRHFDYMIGTYTEWGWMFPCYYDAPTHWMPLPEPPKGGTDDV